MAKGGGRPCRRNQDRQVRAGRKAADRDRYGVGRMRSPEGHGSRFATAAGTRLCPLPQRTRLPRGRRPAFGWHLAAATGVSACWLFRQCSRGWSGRPRSADQPRQAQLAAFDGLCEQLGRVGDPAHPVVGVCQVDAGAERVRVVRAERLDILAAGARPAGRRRPSCPPRGRRSRARRARRSCAGGRRRATRSRSETTRS